MLFTLSPDLLDGLTLIGLISLMATLVCPLLIWALRVDVGQPNGGIPTALHEKTT